MRVDTETEVYSWTSKARGTQSRLWDGPEGQAALVMDFGATSVTADRVWLVDGSYLGTAEAEALNQGPALHS